MDRDSSPPAPTISSAPGDVAYDSAFSISTPDAGSIGKVALVRLGAVTHSVNMEQRYVPLSFTAAAGTINATAPANANIAPPGPYMLFLINGAGVPSVAKMVNVRAAASPTISSVSPAADASGVARTTKVTAAFDRAMDKASVEAAFSLKRTSNGATVSGSFSWNGNEMTFTPNAALNGTTSYTATVGTGARDTAGANLAAAKSWQFTTASQPVDLDRACPSDGAAEVLPDALAFAVFDTAMDKPSAEAAFSLKRTSNGASVAGSFIWFGNALIFKPDSILESGTQYTATVATGARDAAGNPLPATKTWSFTTTSRPFVQSVSPAAGASGVARTTKVTAAFDRAMNKSSVEAAFSLKRTSNGATVSGSFSWNGNEMTFTPSATLNGTTSYTAAVGTGARDTAGTNLAAAKSWQFTTAAQPVISTVCRPTAPPRCCRTRWSSPSSTPRWTSRRRRPPSR